jgi:hypothetical protein
MTAPCHCETGMLFAGRSNLSRLTLQQPRLLRRFSLNSIKVIERTAPRNDKGVWVCGGGDCFVAYS